MKKKIENDWERIGTKLLGGVVAVLLTLMLGLAAGCAPSGASAPDAGMMDESASEVYTVQTGTLKKSIEFLGNIEYEQAAKLKWETGGVIGAVNVSVGDRVKKGDILAELTTDSLSTAVLNAEKELVSAMDAAADVMVSEVKKYQALATLAFDEVSLKATKAAQEKLYYPRGTSQDLEMAYDSLQLAEKNFGYAKQDFMNVLDNYKSWGEDETRATYFESYQQNYQSLQSAYAKWKYLRQAPEAVELAFAQGAVANAQRIYDEVLKEFNSYSSIPRAKDLKSANSAVDLAENTYGQRYITAPFDGLVASVSAEVDQVVAKDTDAIQLVDDSAYYLEVQVNEVDRDKVAVGQPVAIRIDVLPGRTYAGKIIKMDNAAVVSNSGIKFAALMKLDTLDPEIKAGMSASVEFPTATIEDVLLVPVSAITTKNGVRTVQRITANGTEPVEITIGRVNTFAAEVTGGGLRPGDRLSVPSIDPRFYEVSGIAAPEVPVQK